MMLKNNSEESYINQNTSHRSAHVDKRKDALLIYI